MVRNLGPHSAEVEFWVEAVEFRRSDQAVHGKRPGIMRKLHIAFADFGRLRLRR